MGQALKGILGQVFNYKLDCFALIQAGHGILTHKPVPRIEN